MFNLPGRGFRQRITSTSSIPMTLNDVIIHVRQYLAYQIPCKNYGAEYIGETGRLLKTRLEEHRKDVDNTKNGKYRRVGGKR